MAQLGLFVALFALVVCSIAATSKNYITLNDDIRHNALEEIAPWNQNLQIRQLWKRDTSSDNGLNWKHLPASGYLKKLYKLSKEAKNLPEPIKEAIKNRDFSSITVEDVKQVNVTILEYIPPEMMANMNETVLEQVVSKFLSFNRPNALGRLVETVSEKLSPVTLLDKIKQTTSQQTGHQVFNDASGVLLYSAVSRLGDIGGLTERQITKLKGQDLLKFVPEEQLMRVNESNAAKALLEALYGNTDNPEANEPDDKALVYKLVETQNGPPKDWSEETIRTVASKYLKFLPAATLKQFSPDKISNSIFNLRDGNFDTPLQAKTVADSYMASEGFTKNSEGIIEGKPDKLQGIFDTLKSLSAFVNPSVTNNPNLLSTIISECDKLKLPAPLQAVSKFLKSQFRGKNISSLTKDELRHLKPDVLRNCPPEVVSRAMETNAIDDAKVKEIGNAEPSKNDGIFGNSFFKGMIAQMTSFVVQKFKEGVNKYNVQSLPSSFIGGIGVKGTQNLDNTQLLSILDRLKDPRSVDMSDEQKALFLKKLTDTVPDWSSRIPPEYAFLIPRTKGKYMNGEELNGLPSDSELRLVHAQGKLINPGLLERDPSLIGTLTPKQVESIDLQNIPAILAAVRKSKDGPQPQTLKALSKRFAEYIRLKSDEYDTEDKKLLKFITAAEVSKLPASVLAYFVDKRQTAKLPASVRKEMMIALGEMTTKDRALIPDKTREEIILQGLDALDSILGDEGLKTIDLPDLAAIGHSVVDLHPNIIQKLTPVAFEQALDMIQGTTEEDGGLKQRACLNPEQKKAWRNKIIENYGKPKSWDPSTVSTLCCLLPLLDEDDLKKIDKESIVTCHCISDSSPPPHLIETKKSLDKACEKRLGKPDDTKKVFEKIRTKGALDLSDLESQIIPGLRKKRAHDHSKHKRGLTCFVVRLAGNPAEFDHDTLATLKPKDMKDCLYELGSVKLSHGDERLLWDKLVEANGRLVRNIPVDQLKQAGYILTGIKSEEVNDLDLADDDVIAAISRPLGFSKTLLTKMAGRIEMVRYNQEHKFVVSDLIILRNILCGFNIETLQRIVPETFGEALPILRDLDPNCELSHLAALLNIAMHEKVYGDPGNWTAADVRGVGILLKGVNGVKKIPPEAFLGLSPTVAAGLTENTLNQLSKEQLSFIPKFSAQGMSEAQVNSLSLEGQEALHETIQGPLVTDAARILQPISTLPTLFTIFSIFVTITTNIF